MNAITRNLVISGLTLIMLGGCATSKQMVYQSPNVALQNTLNEYNISAESGITCQSSTQLNINCPALAADLRALNMQYSAHQDIGFFSALVEYQLGRREQAQFVLDVLLSEPEPAEIPVLLLRAKVAMDEGNVALAREVLHNGLRTHPDQPEIYNHLAATFYLEGRYEHADASLVTADKLGLAPWKTNFLLGLLHKEKQEVKAACQYFSNTLRLNPGNKRALANLIDLSRYNECAADSIF